MVMGPETIPIGNSVLIGLGGMMSGVLHAPLTAISLQQKSVEVTDYLSL